LPNAPSRNNPLAGTPAPGPDGIFYLSDQPNLGTGLELDFVLRKLAHMAEYAALALLLNRALSGHFGVWTPRSLGFAIVVAMLYAAGDEVHQSYVVGRSGNPIDVVIDAVGIALAAVALVQWGRRPPTPQPRRRTM
jgi:VanZ family protein